MLPRLTSHTLSILELEELGGNALKHTEQRELQDLYKMSHQFNWTTWKVIRSPRDPAGVSGGEIDPELEGEIRRDKDISFILSPGGDYRPVPKLHRKAEMAWFAHSYVLCLGRFTPEYLTAVQEYLKEHRIRGWIIPQNTTSFWSSLLPREEELWKERVEYPGRWQELLAGEVADMTEPPGLELAGSCVFSRLDQMIQSRQLFWANGSIPSWKVMILMYELGIKFEACRRLVMSKPKETQVPEFLALNPRGKTPTMIDRDGSILRESGAIMEYLMERYGSLRRSLMPTDPVQRAEVRQLMQEAEQVRTLYGPMEILFIAPEKMGKAQKVKYENLAQTLSQLAKEMEHWERQLEGKDYLMGAQMTLADLNWYPVLAYMVHRGMKLGRYPNLSHYYTRMSTRPSCQQAHPVGWVEGKGINLFDRAKTVLETRDQLEISPEHPTVPVAHA